MNPPKPPPQNEPLINLQIHQQKPPQAQPKAPGTYIPLPGNMYLPNGMPNTGYTYIPQMVPIINNYKIESHGPNDNHVKLSMLYEDVLPKMQFTQNYGALDERIHLYEFVRSVLVKEKNGNITVFSNNTNSLLNYVKFMELNPYKTSIYTNNPYHGMPKDMLIYRSCYPIVFNQSNSSVMCSKNSIGVNVRIYKLSDNELQLFYDTQYHKMGEKLATFIPNEPEINKSECDIWREVAYYEYVREHIIKTKISPNFVILYTFNVVLTPFIDFNKLAQIQGFVSKADGKYKGKSLILITESPTYNLYGWASNSYQIQNNIKKMIYTGFYSEKIWYSILFQLMAALYTMQKHNFIVHDFSVENNVFIRDLVVEPTNIKHWKYRIENIDYYIPNYGYLVMIDSKYQDINKNITQHNKTYKTYGEFIDKYDEKDIKNRCFTAFRNCFTNNIFSDVFIKNGGVKPPDSISEFISKIGSHINKYRDKTLDINFYITLCMTRFMNNRIGTILKSHEVAFIRTDDKTKFEKGQIIVYEYAYRNYKFVMYDNIGKPDKPDEQNEHDHLIFTKENPTDNDIVRKYLPGSKLYNFSAMEVVMQNYKLGEINFSEDNLIETYTC